MTGASYPKFLLLQFGMEGLSWILLVVGLILCGFAWWKTQKRKSALAVVFTAMASLLGIMIIIGLQIFFLYTAFGRGGATASNDVMEGIIIALLILLALSWITCSICFFSFACRGGKPSGDQFTD